MPNLSLDRRVPRGPTVATNGESMVDEIRSDDPVEGEYTDAEVPADAAVPKGSGAAANDGDWDGDGDVVVEEADAVVVETEGEYTDTDFDGDGVPGRS
jgi:hypothetical protein